MTGSTRPTPPYSVTQTESVIAAAHRIGESIAAPASDPVDREARFPSETINALRELRFMGAIIPKELGGLGLGISEVSGICQALGQYCASSAMVYAMHQIQVACIARHGRTPFFRDYLSELAREQSLIASATSEVNIGGDVRTSSCAVECDGDVFTLAKQAPVISYGEHADAFLITARRNSDAAPSDQVLVLARRAEVELAPTSGWDALGFRGTCSPGFKLRASGHVDQILPVEFAEISGQTMLPVSHILWSSLWSGIATDAVGRARTFVRGEARKKPGVISPGALRAADASSSLQAMKANISECVREYERSLDDREAPSQLGFAIRMNNLKVASSKAVVDIVGQAMLIAGMAGYKVDSPLSIGRHLRDAYGAMLMINNDRIGAATASMLTVHKHD